MDKVYDACVKLSGARHDARWSEEQKKHFGDKIPIRMVLDVNAPSIRGSVPQGGFQITIIATPGSLRERGHSTVDYVGMHEMGHVFENQNPAWSIDGEAMADLFAAHALEYIKRDTALRKSIINSSLSHGEDKTFSGGGSMAGSAYALYLFGLVDQVGWDAYTRAFKSYTREDHRSAAPSRGGDPGRARDLLERIGGNKLRSLPDKGRLLDKHFPRARVQEQRVQPDIAPGVTPPPPEGNKIPMQVHHLDSERARQ